MKKIILGIIFVLITLANSALFAQGLDMAVANTSLENLEKIEECPKNQILKFSDGKSDCISKTIFYNMNAIQDRLALDDVGLVSFFLNKIGGSLNRIAVTVQPEICPVSQALSFRAALWGDSIPKSSAIKLCEKTSKSTDSNCNCEDIADIANKRNREEFYKFQIDYLLAYVKKNNISEKGVDYYVRGTALNKYKPDLVASIYSKLNNTQAQTKETDSSQDASKLQEENKKLAKELAELKEQNTSKVELNSPINTVISPTQTISVTGVRKALVIGNDSYKSVAKLNNAREDAKSITNSLTELGYDVTLRTDVTEKQMKESLRIFKSQVNPGDEVAIYYAGHGVQIGSTNYLLPIDIGADSEDAIRDEAIPLQRLLDDMSEKYAKFTLVMLDACRDNPFKLRGRAIGGGRGLAPTNAATGQMVIFSAGTGQQALDKLGPDDKDRNGLFTRVLLGQIKKIDLTIDKIMKNVRVEVAQIAKSVGHDQVPAIYDQVLGDFFFAKR